MIQFSSLHDAFLFEASTSSSTVTIGRAFAGRDFLGELRPLFQLFQLQVHRWVSWVWKKMFICSSIITWWFIIFLKTLALPQEQLEPASSCKIVHCYASSGNVGMTPSQVTTSGRVWSSMLGKIMVRYAAESGYCFNVKIGRNTWRTPYIICKLICVILIYQGNLQ